MADLKDLQASWTQYPPLPAIAASYFGYEAPETIDTSTADLAKVAGKAPVKWSPDVQG